MLHLNNHYYYETIDSTNLKAKELAKEGCPEGTIVSAGYQAAGRGRRGRSWESPSQDSIATSMVLYPKMSPDKIGTVTLLAAIAVARAIESLPCGFTPLIKWPNDIVLKNKKICGILTEMSAVSGKAEYVVLGIGVNVHNRTFPEEIREKATSLDLVQKEQGYNSHISRKQLVEEIWQQFAQYYEHFQQWEDMSFCLEEYHQLLVNQDKQVRVLDPMGDYEGIARGINPRGELLVETKAGIRAVNSGEVSVRGMYHYV